MHTFSSKFLTLSSALFLCLLLCLSAPSQTYAQVVWPDPNNGTDLVCDTSGPADNLHPYGTEVLIPAAPLKIVSIATGGSGIDDHRFSTLSIRIQNFCTRADEGPWDGVSMTPRILIEYIIGDKVVASEETVIDVVDTLHDRGPADAPFNIDLKPETSLLIDDLSYYIDPDSALRSPSISEEQRNSIMVALRNNGSFKIRVTDPRGQHDEIKVPYTVEATPHLDSLTPNPAYPGNQVLVSGSGFSPTSNKIHLVNTANSLKKYDFTDIAYDNGTLTFSLPADIPAGSYVLTANAAGGDWNVSNGLTLKIENACPIPNSASFVSYADKLRRLQSSVGNALTALQARRDAWRAANSGSTLLQGNHSLDGPLYLLTKMQKDLATDGNNSLIDHAGLVRFFTYLKSLKTYADPAFADVITSANNYLGFSYLSTPVAGKPPLIFIPGAGGEAGWRGALTLLNSEADNFNLIGYTYDPTLQSTEMTKALVSKFTQFTQGWSPSCQPVAVSLSMGSTLIHSAILAAGLGPKNIFAHSYIISTGFVPGAAEFLGKVRFILPIVPYAYPISAGMVSIMNPENPVYKTIADNMLKISQSTKGISYINAKDDQHINFTDSVPDYYKYNRDTIFAGMQRRVDVIPPSLYVSNNGLREKNSHINLLYAPEVTQEVNYDLKSVTGSVAFNPGGNFMAGLFTTLGNMFTFSSPSKNLASVSDSLGTDTSEDIFAAEQSFLGDSGQNECDALAEDLEDDVMVGGTDTALRVDDLKQYTAFADDNYGLSCSYDTVVTATETKLAQVSKDMGIVVTIPPQFRSSKSVVPKITSLTSYDPHLIIPGDYLVVTASGLSVAGNKAELVSIPGGELHTMAVGTIESSKLVFTLPKDLAIGTYGVKVATQASDWSDAVPITVQSNLIPNPNGGLQLSIMHPKYIGSASAEVVNLNVPIVTKPALTPTPKVNPQPLRLLQVSATPSPIYSPTPTYSPSPSPSYSPTPSATRSPSPTPSRSPSPSPSSSPVSSRAMLDLMANVFEVLKGWLLR